MKLWYAPAGMSTQYNKANIFNQHLQLNVQICNSINLEYFNPFNVISQYLGKNENQISLVLCFFDLGQKNCYPIPMISKSYVGR